MYATGTGESTEPGFHGRVNHSHHADCVLDPSPHNSSFAIRLASLAVSRSAVLEFRPGVNASWGGGEDELGEGRIREREMSAFQ